MRKTKKNQRDSLLNRVVPYLIRAAFVVAILVAGALACVRLVYLLRTWVENRIQAALIARLQTLEERVDVLVASSSPSVLSYLQNLQNPPPVQQKDIFAGLTQSSFTDLFSGVGWLDETKTDLYQDKRETAFILPPALTSQKLDSHQIPAGGWAERGVNGEYSRCIGGRCLTERNSELSFQGNPLSLPAEISGKEKANVSIGSLDTKWLVGVVTKEEARYEGWIFLFDGSGFLKIFGGDGKFNSSYAGALGFGGSDNDWLAIYSGYEGIAYRVREGVPPEDISRFLDIRVMKGGFEPAVLRVGVPPTWYVFSMTPGNPQLIKLFQNKTNYIQGAVNLFPFIDPLQGSSLATFGIKEVGGDAISLAAKVTGGSGGWWQIDDRGFKKDRSYEVVSSNINTSAARVVYARIETLDLKERDASASFFVSGDDRVWHAVRLHEVYEFSPSSKELYWRAVFSPDGDPFSSPYFNSILLHYWLNP